MLRPGPNARPLGGLHRFMNWPHAILTDSAVPGHVAGLLAQDQRGGVAFRSHLDGSPHLLTPERSIAIQQLLGADITMALDECTPFPAERAAVEASMELSMRWAERSRAASRRAGPRNFRHRAGRRARRSASALGERLVGIGFDGYAIGGLAIGEARRQPSPWSRRACRRYPKTARAI